MAGNTATSGYAYGVFGQSSSSSGVGVGGYAGTTTGVNYGVFGQSASTTGRGVYGVASSLSGMNYGGFFETESPSGIGVFGRGAASSGSTYGVWGQSDSTDGVGVLGEATATAGTTFGVYARSDSPSGRAVYGRALATSGDARGVYGVSDSTAGLGTVGHATAATGNTNGVYGQCDSTTGRGVYGFASATTGSNFGGYFESASTSGYGVYGRNNATSGTIYGVRGYASTAAGGYAVYAAGDLGASGAKPFRIDHPQDPANKYLLHYSTESPEVLNSYSGKVTLDGAGEAVVELPAYFASINKDPRYTLTAVGAAMPNLHVAEEISEEALLAGEQAEPGVTPPTCSFRIAGGASGGKVSWRVEAVRNDLRVRLHGAPVERDKTGPERGKYQNPEYYGQPPEMGMDYDAEREQRSPEYPASTDGLEDTQKSEN